MTVEPKSGSLAHRRTALGLLGVAAMLFTQLPWMARTNFTGFDEWLIIDLVSKGIIDVPHGNRPVHLLWLLPAALAPYSVTPYVVLHALYGFLSGALVFLLCRRLVPGRPLLWLLTAILSVVWGPGDLARLSTIERSGYTAFEFATLLAIFLLVESWVARSIPLLAFAALVAFLGARSYEAVVPLLLFAPLALLRLGRDAGGRLRTWVAAWEGVLALAILLIVLPRFRPTDVMAYQLQVLGLDLNPGHVALRLGRQFLYHLGPVLLSAPSELATAAVPIALAAFASVVAAWTWVARGSEGEPGWEEGRLHGGLMAVGLLWACLAYGVLALTPSKPSALRMQILSAPGIALFLSSLAFLLSGFVAARWRRLAVVAMGAWLVAVGTGRTVAMQKTWDSVSAYPGQVRMLTGLTEAVPDVKPHTLIVLLDQGRAWRATYGFRHAVEYLYQGRAIGYIPGAWDALYPTFFTNEGIRVEPWPALRGPWGIRVSLHRYDETIVVRHGADGRVEVLDVWPAELAPLPPGARYDPGSRVVLGGPVPPERSILAMPGPSQPAAP